MTDDKARDSGEPGPAGSGGAPGELIDDERLLQILEEAIEDERAAQDKYRRGLGLCADAEACQVFEDLLHEEQAHERALSARYAEVKKRIGLHGAGRPRE